MSTPARTQARGTGRPLVALLALLSVWVTIRASVWEPPFALSSPDTLFAQAHTGERSALAPAQARSEHGGGPPPVSDAVLPSAAARVFGLGGRSLNPTGARRVQGDGRGRVASPFARARSSASHQRLFAAAYGAMPDYASMIDRSTVPGMSGKPGRARRLEMTGTPAGGGLPGAGAKSSRPDLWSADAWLLVREGSNRQRLAGINPAALGSDQVGVVVRYALGPASPLQPQAYARASKALVADGEIEGAAGLSIAPARALPLRIHAELRATEREGETGRTVEVRPAAFVTTGLPRRELAPGIESEAFVQAGYVGGDFETGFVDGKATLEASLAKREEGRIALGAGAWGGAQRDASRFDIGPTASVSLKAGKAAMQGSIDYRFRVAGDAVPDDGLAITLAASF